MAKYTGRLAPYSVLAFLVVALSVPSIASAGWFTKEPPDAWLNLPVVFSYKGKHGRFTYEAPGQSPECLGFGIFIQQVKKPISLSPEVAFEWREGQSSKKWMLDIRSTDEETGKKRLTTLVFEKILANGQFPAVLFSKIYIDTIPMPDTFIIKSIKNITTEYFKAG